MFNIFSTVFSMEMKSDFVYTQKKSGDTTINQYNMYV